VDKQRGIKLKIVVFWLAILLVGSFWLTIKASSEPVSLAVVPQVPREGEPVIATLKLSNPTAQSTEINYQFYANGELVKQGEAILSPYSSKVYQYIYRNPLELGEQVNFIVRAVSSEVGYEKVVSIPSYPPQIWSSFVSFASFSTSVMSSMTSITYYQTSFDSDMGFNIGILCSTVLIGLLIFLELTQPLIQDKTVAVLGKLRLRFGTVTWILLIIFLGIVYTKIVMILAT